MRPARMSAVLASGSCGPVTAALSTFCVSWPSFSSSVRPASTESTKRSMRVSDGVKGGRRATLDGVLARSGAPVAARVQATANSPSAAALARILEEVTPKGGEQWRGWPVGRALLRTYSRFRHQRPPSSRSRSAMPALAACRRDVRRWVGKRPDGRTGTTWCPLPICLGAATGRGEASSRLRLQLRPEPFRLAGCGLVGFIERFGDRIYHAHMKDVWWSDVPKPSGVFGASRLRAPRPLLGFSHHRAREDGLQGDGLRAIAGALRHCVRSE